MVGGNLDTTKPMGELPQLERKIQDVLGRNGEMPIVFLGDFDSSPRVQPGLARPDVYQALTGEQWGLTSAYASVLGEETAFTAWGEEWKFLACIDYIFCKFTPSAQLRALAVLDVPSLPPDPATEPNDHLPLVARLAITTH